jgi:L-seryl-tRNA(Ser) seleniumtransferase
MVAEKRMNKDRFGNRFAPGLPYARGSILGSTDEDFLKLTRAWQIIEGTIRGKGKGSLFNFTGLERSFQVEPEDWQFVDDELSPAVYSEKFTALALEHLGGSPHEHDVALFNRMTAATLATHFTLVRSGDVVVGVSVGYSHPSIVRAARQVGARFVDTVGVASFASALEREERVSLVALTRLAVTYEMMPLDALREVVHLAGEKEVPVYVDDAGGARVGPAIFNQPRMLELGVDVGATGLDKYGTCGPRLGLMAGKKELVGRIRSKAFEFGLEARPMLYGAAVRSLRQYDPRRVVALVECTKKLAVELRKFLGYKLHETPVTAQLRAEDILEIALERAGLQEPTIVPYEAVAALAMLLLQDYGILTVHFAGLPPGTSSLLFKFIPPETLERFGGARKFAEAVDASLNKLASIIGEPEKIRRLLLEKSESH